MISKNIDKIIIGAPINGMMWVKTAKEFVINNSTVLKTKIVGLFFDAYLIDNCYGFWNSKIKKSLSKFEDMVKPLAIGKFGGRVDKAFTGVPKLLFGNKSDAPLDRRNWESIDEFIKKML
jgi:menaquinone-dependent protoporphyrinogen IX oxidase